MKNSPAQQDGGEVVPIINKMIADHTYDLVAYTIDWHPADHCSFVTNVGKYPLDKSSKITAGEAKMYDTVVYAGEKTLEQVLWPPHCVQHSDGAKLHPDLKVPLLLLLGIFCVSLHIGIFLIIISLHCTRL